MQRRFVSDGRVVEEPLLATLLPSVCSSIASGILNHRSDLVIPFGDFDQVITELGFHGTVYFIQFRREDYLVKLRHHLTLREFTQRSA